MPKTPTKDTEKPAAEAEIDPNSAPKREPGFANFAAKLGLPQTPGPRTTFDRFVKYWRSIPAEKRVNISVYVYSLFPVLRLPPGEHAVAVWPGENLTPIGGDSGDNAEEAVLAELGAGDYHMMMKYYNQESGKSITVLATWLTGYEKNLPGWRDFNANPPKFVRDPAQYLVLDDEKNIRTGYIQFLKVKGLLPANAGTPSAIERQREDSNMAVETAAQTTAVGALGKVVDKLLDRPDAPTQTPAPSAENRVTEYILATAQKTMDMMSDTMKMHATNVPEIMRATAELVKPAPEKPDTTTPLVERMLESNAKANEAIAALHSQRADDYREELRETRADIRRLADRAANPIAAGSSVGVPSDPLDALLTQVDKIERLKSALGFKKDDEDDLPPRRRRFDEDDEPKEKPSLLESIFSNLPTIVQGVIGVGSLINLTIHNARVMKTGEGETQPPPADLMASMSGMFPGGGGGDGGPFGGGQNHPGVGGRNPTQIPNPTQMNNPNPNPQGDPNQMNQLKMLTDFLTRIEAGLLGAFERGETGYEYAEVFIKSYGRSGAMGYATLTSLGERGDQSIPEPDRTVNVVASILAMYPPIWTRIGNEYQRPKLREFLTQFLGYDELLGSSRDLLALANEYEVGSVRELLVRMEEDDDPDDNNENDESDLRLHNENPDLSDAIPIKPETPPRPIRVKKPPTTSGDPTQ